MMNPALVIGLGGTGQWILTYLKRNLLEIGNGSLPAEIKLLCFDTASRATAKTGRPQSNSLEEDIHAGTVRLVEGEEFISFGSDIYNLAKEIAHEERPHLRWYPASNFLKKLPASAFNMSEGSGQIRQMGRLALFSDLSSLPDSKVYQEIARSIQDLGGRTQLEIIVVASLAGGTGAGMLIDVALIAQNIAFRLGINCLIRGFIVLPRAFSSGGMMEGREMLARSFAAWRELDRFATVDYQFGKHQVYYHDKNSDLRLQISRRVIDIAYLIEAPRGTESPLANLPIEESVFPAVANCISATLDENAGRVFREYITNLSSRLVQLPRDSYYSSIGSYSFHVPTAYAERLFTHQLLLDALHELATPKVNEKGIVFDVSESDNEERAFSSPERDVEEFLRSSGQSFDNYEVPNTPFLSNISEVRVRKALEDSGFVERIAYRVSPFLLDAFVLLHQTEEDKLTSREIASELQYKIWYDVPPSRQVGDTPEMAFQRIKEQVPLARQKHYGVIRADGVRVRGNYGKALEQAKAAQTERFRNLLIAWTLKSLNGTLPDPSVARRGKIGYTRAFYIKLIADLNYFVEFLNVVRTRRNELLLTVKTQEDAQRAWWEYDRLKNKRCIFAFWDNNTHPDAHHVQREYLRAEQRDIEVLKDDILLEVVRETVLGFTQVAKKALEEIQSWIVHLAVGDPTLGNLGLYQEIKNTLANIRADSELDNRLSQVSQVIGVHEYHTDSSLIREVLKNIKWRIRTDADEFSITCGIESLNDDQSAATYTPFQREGENPTRHNLLLLQQMARRPYKVTFQDSSFTKEISRIFYAPERSAEALASHARPLYVGAVLSRGPAAKGNFILTPANIHGEPQDYFAAIQEHMARLLLERSVSVAETTNPYELTFIQSHDLLPSTEFELWHRSREAYIRQVTDPHLGLPAQELYIFPEEINASQYETELPKVLGIDYRILHPDIVALLDDKDKFEMFFQCWAYGIIQYNEKECIIRSEDGQINHTLWEKQESFYKNLSIIEIISKFVYHEKINWDLLRDAILDRQKGLGRTRAIMLFRKQIEAVDGFIQVTKRELERKRASIADDIFRRSIGSELEDLITLAEYIYLKSIDSANILPLKRKDLYRFAERAEFEVRKYRYPNIVKLIPADQQWKTRFERPILACQTWDSDLDINLFLELVQQIEGIRKEDAEIQDIILLAVDKKPPEDVMAEIYRLRAENGLRFILMGEDIFTVSDEKIPSVLEDYLFENLGPQRDLYEQRMPVSDPLHFFGREQTVSELNQRLINGELIGLFGIRKIGKSSLLRYMQRNASFPVAYLDLQAGQKYSDIFLRALQHWYESPVRLALHWQPNMDQSDAPERNFAREVERLRERSMMEGRGLPVLFLDEIELIFPSINSSEMDVQNFLSFARIIRGLVQEGQMSAVFAGVDASINHINRIGRRQNPFYQALSEKYLGPISEKDCKEMIVAIGLRMGLTYDDSALDAIVRLSGGHPFFARMLCSTAFQSRQRRKGLVSLDDIETAQQRFISQPGTADLLNEQGLWREMTDAKLWGKQLSKEMQNILIALSQDESDKGQKITFNATEAAIYELTQRGVLREMGASSYSMQISLFRNWIKRYILGG